MAVKIGFEFELGHPGSRKTFAKNLRAELTPFQGSNLLFKNDYSVDVPYLNNVEVVTKPLPESSALKMAEKLLDIFPAMGCKTNETTGLHVNISVATQTKRINPFALLSHLNEMKYLKKWRREDSYYARPWEKTFLAKLQGESNNTEWVPVTNDYEAWKQNCDSFMRSVCGFYDKENYSKVVKMQYDKYLNKRISVSMPYVWERGYVEYRIIGGDYLHRRKSVLNDINHFIETTKYATNYDLNEVEKYMKRLYTKFSKQRKEYA